MSEYTPTTSEVRAEYFSTRDHGGETAPERAREFDRWLESVRCQVSEAAWDEGARVGYRMYEERPADMLRRNPYREEKGR